MTIRSMSIVAVASVLVAAGCASVDSGRSARPAAPQTGKADPRDQVDASLALQSAGYHLEASYFLEAALANGGDEKKVLPLLVAAQVRAGRLSAARRNLARLKEIEPGREGADELAALLDRLAPGPKGAKP